MIKLSKIFSRERPLIHFSMWDESDRLGFHRFFSYKMKNNLFLKEGQKTSVWYDLNELDKINGKIKQKLVADKNFINKLNVVLKKYWKDIFPYVSEKKKLKTTIEAKKYYGALVKWWSAMTIIFSIPDLNNVPEILRKKALKIRIEYEKYSASTEKPLEDFWKKLYPKHKELASVAAIHELKELNKDNLAVISKRRRGFALFNSKLYTLQQLNRELQKRHIFLEEEEKAKKVTELKGMPANKGIAKGTVRIILSKEQFRTFKENEVLVAEMTEPTFIPLMKKASAILTDEGGITSHAAITSRELNKPCIVGIKNATRVLKNGNLVEVNADKGTVRILK